MIEPFFTIDSVFPGCLSNRTTTFEKQHNRESTHTFPSCANPRGENGGVLSGRGGLEHCRPLRRRLGEAVTEH